MKYQVSLWRDVREWTEIYVEADSPAQAIERATSDEFLACAEWDQCAETDDAEIDQAATTVQELYDPTNEVQESEHLIFDTPEEEGRRNMRTPHPDTPYEHTAARTETGPFFFSQRPHDPNPAAHGDVTDHETCRCGAERWVNRNGQHEEAGDWQEVGEEI